MGLRVVHVVTDVRRRGAQTSAQALHRALAARGYDSVLLALSGQGLADGGIPDAHVLPGGHRLHPAGLLALRRRAARPGTVVVAHGSTTLDACALALPGTRTPFVYLNVGDPRHWSAKGVRRLRVRTLLRRAAAVASVSPGARDALVALHGLSPRRVHVIPNGRDPHRYSPGPRAGARAGLGIPDGVAALAYVGALSPEKRPDVAVDAVAALGPGHLLLVAGEGPLQDELADRADRVAPGLVRFLGNLADPVPLYRAADALVLSGDSEGVPGVAVEAGLCALPAAATDAGFTSDVVRDGETGALAPTGDPAALADAVRRVLEHRDAYAAAALAHCRAGYAMEGVVDAWCDLIARTA